MNFEYILYDARDHIGKITLNRPKTYNGYHERMVKEIVAAIDLARQDDDTRVLIVTGTGKAFCAGGDISGSTETRPRFRGHPMGLTARCAKDSIRLALSLNRFDKPVIAAINGAAVAGGLTLALCCDFRIASDQARLGDTALKFGSCPTRAAPGFSRA